MCKGRQLHGRTSVCVGTMGRVQGSSTTWEDYCVCRNYETCARVVTYMEDYCVCVWEERDGGCCNPVHLSHPISQLIPVVILQRRLCIGLHVPSMVSGGWNTPPSHRTIKADDVLYCPCLFRWINLIGADDVWSKEVLPSTYITVLVRSVS
jgi:hypothetical protein